MKGSVRAQFGLVHGALHRVDAPSCTGCVEQMGSGAQRETSMTTDSLCHPVPVFAGSEVTQTRPQMMLQIAEA